MKKAAGKNKIPESGVAFGSSMISEDELAHFRESNWDLRRFLDEKGEEDDPFYENESVSSADLVDAGTEYWDKKAIAADADEDDPEDHTPITDAVSPETAAAMIAQHDPDETEILRLDALSGVSPDDTDGIFMGMTKKEIAGESDPTDHFADSAEERLLLMICDGAFPDNTDDI